MRIGRSSPRYQLRSLSKSNHLHNPSVSNQPAPLQNSRILQSRFLNTQSSKRKKQ